MDLVAYAAQISPSSKIPSCAKWDPASVYSLYKNGTVTITQYNELRSRLDRLQLFPSPNDRQGPSWIKPVGYLAATTILSGLGEEKLEQKIEIFFFFFSSCFRVRLCATRWVMMSLHVFLHTYTNFWGPSGQVTF